MKLRIVKNANDYFIIQNKMLWWWENNYGEFSLYEQAKQVLNSLLKNKAKNIVKEIIEEIEI